MKTWHAAAILCLATCGCGKAGASAPQLQELPVNGTVTLDGKPLAGAEIVFMTGEPPAAFAGKTKDDGAYRLQTVAGREATCQGACKVTISRLVKPDGSPLGPEETPADAGAVEQLPAKYSRFDQTTLSATVAAGGTTVDFALTSR